MECNGITQKRKNREGGLLSVTFITTIILTGEQMVQPLEPRRRSGEKEGGPVSKDS